MAGTFAASLPAIAKTVEPQTLPDEVKFSSNGEWYLSHPKAAFESLQYDNFLAQAKRGETDVKAHWEYDLLPQTEVVEIEGNIYTVTKPDAQQGKSKLVFDDYTITLSGLVDGSSVKPAKLAYSFEGNRELPAATDTDEWHFEGWFTEPNGQGWQVASIDENSFVDLELFAAYSWKNYLIHFDGNGAVNTMNDIKVARDASITLPQNTISRVGYIFTGWSLKPDESANLINDQQLINLSDPTCKQLFDHLSVSNELTLYAQWIPITYKLILDANDDSSAKAAHTLAYDQTFTLPAVPGIVGYTTAADGTGKWFKTNQDISKLCRDADGEIILYAQKDNSDFATSLATLDTIANYKLNIPDIGEIPFDKFNSYYLFDQTPKSFDFSPVGEKTTNVSFSAPTFARAEGSSYESAVIDIEKDNVRIASYTFEWPATTEQAISFNEAPQFLIAGQKMIDTSALSFGTLISDVKTEASQAHIQNVLFDENRNGGIYVEVDRTQQQQSELLGDDKSTLMITDAQIMFDETKAQLNEGVSEPTPEITNAVIEEVAKEETPDYIQQSLNTRQMTTFQDANEDSSQKQSVQSSPTEKVASKQNETNSPDLLNISIAQVKAEDEAVLASSVKHIESNATLSIQSVVGEGDAVSPQDLAASEVALDTAQTNSNDLGKLLEGNDVCEIGEAILINNDSNANSNDLQFATVNFTSPVFADTVDKHSVLLDGKLLTEGTDYTIEFYGSDPYGDPTVPIQGNPVQLGTYMYRVIGQGMYTGVNIGKITLSKHAGGKSLSQATILYNAPLNERPVFHVVCVDNNNGGNDKWLEEGKDYTVVLYDKDPYGDLTVVVPNGIPQHIGTFGYTIRGIGEYYGTRSGTIEIGNSSIGTPQLIVPGEGIKPTSGSTAPVNIKSASIQMKKEYTYTGKAIKPAITVKIGNTTLKSNTDYTVAYKNNINASSSAKLIISGKGNYTGTKTITFKIAKAPMKKVTTGAIKTMKYTGKKIKPKVTVKFNGKKVAKNNYTITYSDNVNSGYGEIHIKAKTGKNFYGTKTVKFYIAKSSTKTLGQVSEKKAMGKGSNKVSKALSITKEVDIKAQIKRISKGLKGAASPISQKELKTVEMKVNKVKKPFNSYVSKLKTKIKSSRSDKVQVKLDTKAKTATIVFNQAHFTRNEIKTLTKSDKNGFRSDIGFIIEAFPADDPQRKKGMAGDGFSELLTAKGGAKIGTASAKSFGNKNNARKYYVAVDYTITSCYGKYTVPVNELWSSTEYFGPFTVPEGYKVIFTSKY